MAVLTCNAVRVFMRRTTHYGSDMSLRQNVSSQKSDERILMKFFSSGQNETL
jgi:hypothetical protein